MNGPQLGLHCKLYRNTGTVGTPVWTEVSEIGDLTAGLARLFAELKRRASGWVKNIAGLLNLDSFQFKLIHGLGTTNLEAIRDNFLSGTAEEFAIANGDIATSGTQAFRLPAAIENFPINQPLEDIHDHEVTLKLAYLDDGGEVDPSWMTVV
jgi:hypothetical protein